MTNLIKKNHLNFILFLLLIILVLIRLFYKTHFDDEIGSIKIINNIDNIWDLYFKINTWDVSPPLSYIIIYLVNTILPYQYAPIALLPLQIYFINIFLKYSENLLDSEKLNKLVYKLIVIFNPLFILWCTSLRWYSLWVPMALAIIGIFYFKKNIRHRDITIIFLIASLMFHLSYLTLIFILSLIISNYRIIFDYFINNKIIILVLLIINSPQLYYLIFYHLENTTGQIGNIYYSLIMPPITIIFGNSFLMFEYLSIVYFLFLIIIITINFKGYHLKNIIINHKKIIIFVFVFFISMFFLNIGHKPRHSIILNYLFIFFIFLNLSYLNKKKLNLIFISIILIITIYGNKNNILEKNVIKNNINLPVKKIFKIINTSNQSCSFKYIFTHDIKIKYYFDDNKLFILNYDKKIPKENEKCIYIIKSYYDSIHLDEVKIVEKKFQKYEKILKLKVLEYDKFNNLKVYLLSNNYENNFSIKILSN